MPTLVMPIFNEDGILASMLGVIIGLFIFLVYAQELSQEELSDLPFLITGALFVSFTFSSVFCTSIFQNATRYVVLLAACLVLVFLRYRKSIVLYLACNLGIGAIIGKGLYAFAIPLAIAFGCFALFLSVRKTPL